MKSWRAQNTFITGSGSKPFRSWLLGSLQRGNPNSTTFNTQIMGKLMFLKMCGLIHALLINTDHCRPCAQTGRETCARSSEGKHVRLLSVGQAPKTMTSKCQKYSKTDFLLYMCCLHAQSVTSVWHCYGSFLTFKAPPTPQDIIQVF